MTMPWTLNRFDGGWTDEVVDGAPNCGEVVENLVCQNDFSAKSRPGTSAAFARGPAGDQRMKWLGRYDDNWFCVSGRKLYYWNVNTWTEIRCYGNLDAFDADGEVWALIHQRILVLGTNLGSTVRCLYWDDDRSAWSLHSLGIPPILDREPILASDSADPAGTYTRVKHLYTYAACWVIEFASRGRKFKWFGPSRFWQVELEFHTQVNNNSYPVPVDFFTGAHCHLGGGKDIAGYINPAAAAGNGLPTDRIKLGVFRSGPDGKDLYWIQRLNNAVFGGAVTDSTGDTSLGITTISNDWFGTNFPIVDGMATLDSPGKLRGMIASGNALIGFGAESSWALGVDESYVLSDLPKGERIYQNSPGFVWGWPKRFFIDLDDDCTGIGSANGVLVATTKERTYRIEGVFDRFGMGGMRRAVISDGVGGLLGSMVRLQDINLFAHRDGFHATDGFKVWPISRHLRESLMERFLAGNTPTWAFTDPSSERVFWWLNGTNELIVCDPNRGNQPNLWFGIWKGDYFRPGCMAVYNSELYAGMYDGYFVKFDELLYTDVRQAKTNWLEPVIPRFRSVATSFGSVSGWKKVVRVDATIEWYDGLCITVEGAVDLQSTWTDVETMLIVDDGTELNEWRKTRQVFPVQNMFASDDLWCHYRQIGIKGDKEGIGDNTALGQCTAGPLIAGNRPLALTGRTWPPSVGVGAVITINGTDYRVLSAAGDTAILDGAGPALGTYNFVVSRYIPGRLVVRGFDVHFGQGSTLNPAAGG